MAKASQNVKAIFAQAILKTTSEDLSLFLDEVCGSDANLRAEVESLLASHRDAGNFLTGLLDEPIISWKKSVKAEWPWFIWPSSRSLSTVKSP